MVKRGRCSFPDTVFVPVWDEDSEEMVQWGVAP
jgi:hypothetical protein